MIGVVISPAGEADAEAIAAFQTRCWQEAYRGVVPDAFLDAMDQGARTDAWRLRLLRGERQIRVAWHGAAVAGVASWTPGTVDELNTLYVGAEHRGTGLAGDLLNAAIADRPARLWVFDANPRAQAFYVKQGFVATEEVEVAVDPETGLTEVRFERGPVSYS